jgi:hypothetical protein
LINLGTIRYIGKLIGEEKNLEWVGIEWDIEGVGKNDGFVLGNRYFQTKKNTATFVKLDDFKEKLEIIMLTEKDYGISLDDINSFEEEYENYKTLFMKYGDSLQSIKFVSNDLTDILNKIKLIDTSVCEIFRFDYDYLSYYYGKFLEFDIDYLDFEKYVNLPFSHKIEINQDTIKSINSKLKIFFETNSSNSNISIKKSGSGFGKAISKSGSNNSLNNSGSKIYIDQINELNKKIEMKNLKILELTNEITEIKNIKLGSTTVPIKKSISNSKISDQDANTSSIIVEEDDKSEVDILTEANNDSLKLENEKLKIMIETLSNENTKMKNNVEKFEKEKENFKIERERLQSDYDNKMLIFEKEKILFEKIKSQLTTDIENFNKEKSTFQNEQTKFYQKSQKEEKKFSFVDIKKSFNGLTNSVIEKKQPEKIKISLNTIEVGMKIQFLKGEFHKGTIRYFGKLANDEKKLDWIGLEWEIEGVGKNDGMALGVRYFQTKKNTATFVNFDTFKDNFEITSYPIKRKGTITQKLENCELNINDLVVINKEIDESKILLLILRFF